MNYFLLLIFFATSCLSMEKFSRLELLPSDLKMKVLKQIIRKSKTSDQAIRNIRKIVMIDRVFRKMPDYPKHQATLEDYLGWDWNSENSLSFIPENFTLPPRYNLYCSLPEQGLCKPIQDPTLLAFKERFKEFHTLVKTKEPIKEDLLTQMDLYHEYEGGEVQMIYADPSIGEIPWVVANCTPLYIAVTYNNSHAVRQLLTYGCGTQKPRDEGLTPLHLACAMGHKDMIQIFIEHKVPLDAQVFCMKTAMHVAADKGHTEIMNMLLRAGANGTIKDYKGRIAADCIKNRIPVG